MPPKHWPKNFIYSRESVSPEIHHQFLRHCLTTENPEDLHKVSPLIEEKKVHPSIKIQKITKNFRYFGKIHPLADLKTELGQIQRGVFATDRIPKGTELGEFVGEIYLLSASDSIPSVLTKKNPSAYAWLARIRDCFLFIEAKKIANELAFVNDYRGLHSNPNVKADWVIHRGAFYFGYIAIQTIKAGEELLVDYGENYWLVFNAKHKK